MPLAFSVAGTLKTGEIPALLRQQETGNRGSGQLNSGLFERKFRRASANGKKGVNAQPASPGQQYPYATCR